MPTVILIWLKYQFSNASEFFCTFVSNFRNMKPTQWMEHSIPVLYCVSCWCYYVHTHTTSHSVVTNQWYHFINKFLIYRCGISPNNLQIVKCKYIQCAEIYSEKYKINTICSFIRHVNYTVLQQFINKYGFNIPCNCIPFKYKAFLEIPRY